MDSQGTCIPVKALDHVTLALWSTEEALVLFRDVLGGEFLVGGDDEKLGIRTVQVRFSPDPEIAWGHREDVLAGRGRWREDRPVLCSEGDVAEEEAPSP